MFFVNFKTFLVDFRCEITEKVKNEEKRLKNGWKNATFVNFTLGTLFFKGQITYIYFLTCNLKAGPNTQHVDTGID